MRWMAVEKSYAESDSIRANKNCIIQKMQDKKIPCLEYTKALLERVPKMSF